MFINFSFVNDAPSKYFSICFTNYFCIKSIISER